MMHLHLSVSDWRIEFSDDLEGLGAAWDGGAFERWGLMTVTRLRYVGS